jgi:hypothetical protein
MNVCGEITYSDVHSDICIGHDMPTFKVDAETRDFLHANLDEWLDRSNGSGIFWIGDADKVVAYFADQG